MKPIPYHDVFLSHRFADRNAVQQLHDHIERDLGRSVYVDWIEQPDLDRSKVSPETAEHFREVMRACSCLIFYAGPNAAESKWMPWELGFYDGRQGARRIAIYVDDLATFEPGQQEYLGLYKRWWIDRQSLPGFLEQALDDTAAMNSATYDQWQRHARKIARDPVDYAISLVQWCYGASANALIDPEQMQARGDEQPEGPLRAPAALYAPWYEMLRQQQAWYANMRQQWRSVRRTLPAPALAADDAGRHSANFADPRAWLAMLGVPAWPIGNTGAEAMATAATEAAPAAPGPLALPPFPVPGDWLGQFEKMAAQMMPRPEARIT